MAGDKNTVEIASLDELRKPVHLVSREGFGRRGAHRARIVLPDGFRQRFVVARPSAAFDRLFGVRTESFHMGQQSATIDLAREVTAGLADGGSSVRSRSVSVYGMSRSSRP